VSAEHHKEDILPMTRLWWIPLQLNTIQKTLYQRSNCGEVRCSKAQNIQIIGFALQWYCVPMTIYQRGYCGRMRFIGAANR
jgi:hypothetical protein